MPPKKRTNVYRDKQRMREYLQSNGSCYICCQTLHRWRGEGGIYFTGERPEQIAGIEDVRRLESIPVPCSCDYFAHERCLVIWFNRQFQCPTCRKKLIPRVFVDGGAGPRSDQGEGIPIYLRRESLSTQEYFTLQGWDLRDAERHRADDHNDDFEFIPQLQPPPGWGEYMRREHPPRPPRPGRGYPG